VRIVRAGRGAGKTLLGIAEVLAWSGVIKIDGIVPPNRPVQTVIIDSDFKSSKESWDFIERYTPPNQFKRKNQQVNEIAFRNGSTIRFFSAENPESVRGVHPDIWLLNEASKFPPKLWQQIIQPATNTKGKLNRILFLTTPRGHDWFWELWNYYELAIAMWKAGEGRKPDVELFHFTCYDSPFITPEGIVEAQEQMLPHDWRQEMLAEFLDDKGSLFDITNALVKKKLRPPTKEETYCTGFDYAQFKDFSWLISLDSTGEIRALMRMKNVDPEQQVQHAKAFQAAAPGAILMDRTGVGRAVWSIAMSDGVNVIGLDFTENVKKQLLAELHIALKRGEIIIPDDPENVDIQILKQELRAFQYVVDNDRKGSPVSFSAPRGKHDDGVITLALANHMRQYFKGFGSSGGPSSSGMVF